MTKFININFEFSKENALDRIHKAVQSKRKGYVCVVDTNIAVNVDKDLSYHQTIDESLFNICDSSWIPVLYNLKNKTKVTDYKGPDFFLDIIYKKKYNSFFLGSSDEVLNVLKEKIILIDNRIEKMPFYSPPFLKVEDFNYAAIGEMINSSKSDIVWVSLGAPKQEIFMELLLPFLNSAVCVGVGAAFTLNSGYKRFSRAPKFIQKLKMEWVFRIYLEPKKQFKRILKIFIRFPFIIYKEFSKTHSS